MSISSIRHVDGANVFDVDGVAAPLFLITIPRQPSTDYTQEVQLASNGGGRLTWLLGAFYIHNFVSTNSLNFNLAPPLSPAPFPVRLVDIGKETTESISGFGQATWEFVTNTRLTLGARYTHEKRDFHATQTLSAVPIPTRVTPIDSAVSANKPTFRASLDHQFAPQILGYVSFNTGFKSGGYNLFSPTSPAYRPETVKSYEAGFKSELLDRRVRLNAAGFYYDYSNIQVTQVINNTQVISNGAKAKIYGLDVDAQVSLARGLQVSGSFEALHAQFTRFDNAQIARPAPAGGAIIMPGSAAGNRLPLSQKFAATAALDYDTQLAGAGLHFNVSGSYQGGYYFEPDNYIHQPSYVDLSTSLKLTLPGERLSVMAWGKNLLNNAVISFGSATVNGFTTQYYAPPRTYGVTLRYKL